MTSLTLRRLEPAVPVIAAAVLGVGVVQVAYMTAPIVPLVLAGGAALVVLSVVRPIIVLFAAVALAPLELISVDLGAVGVSPAEAMLMLSGFGWAAVRTTRLEAPFTPSSLSWPLALLVLALIPGLLIAQDSFAVVKVVVLWTGFFFVFQMLITDGDEKTVRTLLFVLAISAAVVGAIAVIKSGGTAPELRGSGQTASGRATGSFTHPNTLATFEALALPGALALGLKGAAAVRPFALASFAVIFAGLALSLSRGGLLAVAGALGMMLVWTPFRRTVVVATAIVLVLGFAGGNPLGDTEQLQVFERRIESIGYSAGGVDPRFRLWEVTPQIIYDHPLVGVGANAFPDVAPRYGLLLENSGSTYEHAHNIALTVAAEMGLFGLLALGWIVVALTRELVRGYRRPGADRGVALAVAAAFVAVALQGMVDYTLRSAIIPGVIFALAGCAVLLARGDAAKDGAALQSEPAASR